jgi:hypothetical protein
VAATAALLGEAVPVTAAPLAEAVAIRVVVRQEAVAVVPVEAVAAEDPMQAAVPPAGIRPEAPRTAGK